jgi:hypothetical protein
LCYCSATLFCCSSVHLWASGALSVPPVSLTHIIMCVVTVVLFFWALSDFLALQDAKGSYCTFSF